MSPKENTVSSSTLPIENLSLGTRINWLLVGAVVLTFTNGLVISLLVFPSVSGPTGIATGSSDGWAEIAANIIKGTGFVYDPWAAPSPSTGYLAREPIYALFLASLLAVFGDLEPSMMLLQALANAITCFVLYSVVRKTFNRQAALIACFFYALYPFASWYVPRIAYETLLGLLVTLLALGLVNLFEDLSFRRSLTLGFILGITVLCKGTYLLLPVALVPALIIRFGVWNARAIWCWATIVLTMVSLLSPWVVRNYAVSGEFVPVTTHGGAAFFYGDKLIEHYSLRENTAGELPGEESTQLYNNVRDSIRSQNPHFSHAKVEVEVDKELVRTAIANALTDPMKFAKKILLGLGFVWFLGDTAVKSTALLAMQGPLVLLSLVGIFYAVRFKKQVLPLLTLLVYFAVIQVAFVALGRFSYPMVPILVAFAAYAVEIFRSKYLQLGVGAVE